MKKATYTKPLTVHFNERIYEKIKQESDRLEISMGNYVRDIIQRCVEDDEMIKPQLTN